MADNVFKYYKDLPEWAKGVVVVGGIAIVYFTGKRILDAINAAKELKDKQKEIEDATYALNELSSNGINPTLSETTLQSLSNSVIDAVGGCGTDNEKIKATFKKLQNQADMLLFVKVFGLRQKQRCLFSDDPRESFLSSLTPPMSLSAHIALDLDAAEISALNKILEARNITYKF
jgi:hypothetical protein